ncbi:DUF1488 domain-containing protein [Rhodoplanes sp. TEM]|uniref:DUF1488 domain-containing protein n=1 Tax=Rhodoplanes tepidamans TaxID=200616 RepID=A0ABT5J5Z9_RHOTP|nr:MULTISPECIES: DUF1488 domain-containing protein [Rhodoplanes]MDC7784729.1 DUF1488 domain-containing protein [Rhodoplanes tepidamans]MDC7982196.1 DUF1488 domain-containing protein [Rhodoplanes sp. TEM]MDQ0356201.1 hypothetical protein [Rhodoplanes tepidamans]
MTVTLRFPNRSRYYDTTRRAVGFWAHDSAMEAAFFVAEGLLRRLQPGMSTDEPSMLEAFDAHRDRIQAAAVKAYTRGGAGAYALSEDDF